VSNATPPSTFDAVSAGFGAANVVDPYPLFAKLRETTPVMAGDLMADLGVPSKVATPDGSRPIFTIFRYDDIAAALQDAQTFTSGVMIEAYGKVLGRLISGLDGDEHRRMRSLYSAAFTKRTLARWRSDVATRVLRHELIEPLRARGRADLLADFARIFPVRIIYQILGFPDDPEAIAQFNEWALATLLMFGSGAADDEEAQARLRQRQAAALQAGQELFDHVLEVVRRRRRDGSAGEDLIALLLRAEFEGHSLSDEEITTFVRSLLPAAADTTTRSFANLAVCLLSRPDDLARVRSDPASLPGAVNESLRYEGTLTVAARQAARDVEVRGVSIPAGAGVSLIVGAGNRDPDAFPDPDRFDIRRNGKPLLTFNLGPHMCLGIHIAKMELIEAMAALLDGLPNVRLDPNAPPPTIVGVHFRCPERVDVVWD
jgi:cytochrome P450